MTTSPSKNWNALNQEIFVVKIPIVNIHSVKFCRFHCSYIKCFAVKIFHWFNFIILLAYNIFLTTNFLYLWYPLTTMTTINLFSPQTSTSWFLGKVSRTYHPLECASFWALPSSQPWNNLHTLLYTPGATTPLSIAVPLTPNTLAHTHTHLQKRCVIQSTQDTVPKQTPCSKGIGIGAGWVGVVLTAPLSWMLIEFIVLVDV